MTDVTAPPAGGRTYLQRSWEASVGGRRGSPGVRELLPEEGLDLEAVQLEDAAALAADPPGPSMPSLRAVAQLGLSKLLEETDRAQRIGLAGVAEESATAR
jgi:hypothetical protein